MTFGCTVFEGVIECLEEVSGCGEFECWFEGSKQCEGTLCGGCGPDLQRTSLSEKRRSGAAGDGRSAVAAGRV